MSLWPKPNVTTSIEPPHKPRKNVWVAIYCVLFIVTGLFLMFRWKGEDYFSSISFWLILILFPIISGSVALSARFFLYGLAQEKFDIWQQEKNRVDCNWQDWAMEGINILASYWTNPNDLTAAKVIFDRQNLAATRDVALAYNAKEFEFQYYFEELFYNIKLPLSELSDDISVSITVYSSPDSYCYLDDTIHATYKKCRIRNPYTLQHKLATHAQINKIVSLIDEPKHEIDLIIINNASSTGSAFLSAILLLNEQLITDIGAKVTIESKLLRPMFSDDIDAAISQMHEMQPAISETQQIWFANLTKEQEIKAIMQLASHNISLNHFDYLESVAGKQTDLAYWSLLSLGSQLVKHQKQTILIVTMSQEEYLLSVMTSTNLGKTHEK